MNVKLLRKVAARIKRHAARFNLQVWGERADKGGYIPGMLKIPPCKTQTCIAGETILAAGAGFIPKGGGIRLREKYAYRAFPDLAGDLLGLTTHKEKNRLFKFNKWSMYEGGWPKQFQEAYEEATTPEARAEVAVARIRHFIKTRGKE